MMPMKRYHQSWLPAMFDDFFDNDWMKKTNATAPAINVIENDTEYKVAHTIGIFLAHLAIHGLHTMNTLLI